MRIIYDDLIEFSEILIQCNETVKKGMCHHCSFYNRCEICNCEDRSILRGKIKS